MMTTTQDVLRVSKIETVLLVWVTSVSLSYQTSKHSGKFIISVIPQKQHLSNDLILIFYTHIWMLSV